MLFYLHLQHFTRRTNWVNSTEKNFISFMVLCFMVFEVQKVTHGNNGMFMVKVSRMNLNFQIIN